MFLLKLLLLLAALMTCPEAEQKVTHLWRSSYVDTTYLLKAVPKAMYTNVCNCATMHLPTYTHTCIHTYIHTHIHTCTHSYTHTDTHMHTNKQVYVCILYIIITIYIYIHMLAPKRPKCTHTHTHTAKLQQQANHQHHHHHHHHQPSWLSRFPILCGNLTDPGPSPKPDASGCRGIQYNAKPGPQDNCNYPLKPQAPIPLILQGSDQR